MTFERALWALKARWARDPALKMLGYALLAVSFCVMMAMCSSCAGQSRQVQATVADAVARSANVAEPIVVENYRRALFKCLDDSKQRVDYELCRAKADQQWTRIRLAWGHLRDAQADYATALEKGDADVTTYVQWIRIAYCEFKSYVPKDVKIPDVAGLPCPELLP